MTESLFARPGQNRSAFCWYDGSVVLMYQLVVPDSQNAVATLSRELSRLPVPRLPLLRRVARITGNSRLEGIMKLLHDLVAANHNIKSVAVSRDGEFVANIEEPATQ
jgi:hypothetical protein